MSFPSFSTTTTLSGITTITLNRPHARNAIEPATATALYDAFLAFDADPAQKVLILTGSNGVFCAGFDLKSLASLESSPNTTSSLDNGVTPVTPGKRTQGPMGPTRLLLGKPLIAAIEGPAVAGGLELALLADLRVCSSSAVFGVYCRRFGVPLIDGGTVRLPQIVGLGRALDMVLTGRGVVAQEALEMGLVNRVVGEGEALGEAVRVAEGIVGWPEGCMRVDRSSVYEGLGRGREEGLRLEWENARGVVEREGVQGARRFRDGEGRGGRFGKGKL